MSILSIVVILGLVSIQVDGSNGPKDTSFMTKACTRSTTEILGTSLFYGIALSDDRDYEFAFPEDWMKTEYICSWGIFTLNRTRLVVEFSTGYNDYSKPRFCLGEIRIRFKGIDIKHFKLCNTYDGEDFSLLSKFITDGDVGIVARFNTEQANISDYKFFVNITTEAPDSQLPKVVSVADLILKRKSLNVQDYNFTWSDARQTCRRKFKRWDLCSKHDTDLCNMDGVISHFLFDSDSKYIPLLEYNAWAVHNQTTSSCSIYPGRPPWGMDKNLCPEDGCELKSQILCCPEDKYGKQKPPRPVTLHITSGLAKNLRPVYRFSLEKDLDDSIWSKFWKPTGRIPGDVVNIPLYTEYTYKTETLIFVCTREIDPEKGDAVPDNVRYMMSMNPCKEPWSYFCHAYGTRKYMRGLKTIYFSQGDHDMGTRVSTKPPCCGYNEDDKFILYGKPMNHAVSTRHCFGPSWLSGEFPGTISSYNHFRKRAAAPMDCTWRIDVYSGYGILISYNISGIDNSDGCSENYLEFWNPVSEIIAGRTKNRVLGRVCGTTFGTFWSDGPQISVSVVMGSSIGAFEVRYKETKHVAPKPRTFSYDSSIPLTWEVSKERCESRNQLLCSEEDFCPLGSVGPYQYDDKDYEWVAVGDKTNTWLSLNRTGVCETHTEEGSPVDWEMHRDSEVAPTVGIYCCDREPYPVRVNIWRNTQFGYYYWFRKGEEWKSPDYQHDYSDILRAFPGTGYVHRWKPPSTFGDAIGTTADYFYMSPVFNEYYYDKKIYFCAEEAHDPMLMPWKVHFIASYEECDPYVEGSFHLYGGMSMTEKTPVALYFGVGDITSGYFCCDKNRDSIRVYVKEAGKVLDYVHPDTYTYNSTYNIYSGDYYG